jgi:hypothetical protein
MGLGLLFPSGFGFHGRERPARAVLEGYRQLQNIAAKFRLDPSETFDEIPRQLSSRERYDLRTG